MSEILIIKKPDLLRNELANVLQEKLSIKKVTCYYPNEHQTQPLNYINIDLILIDIDTIKNSLELIKSFIEKNIKVVIWTAEINKSKLSRLFQLGLPGYLIQEMEIHELIFALQKILTGAKYIHPDLSPILLNDYMKIARTQSRRPNDLLTNREWEVLELIVKDKQTNTISGKLLISTKTVTNHVTSILRKLEVSDRTSAALLAIRKGWLAL